MKVSKDEIPGDICHLYVYQVDKELDIFYIFKLLIFTLDLNKNEIFIFVSILFF